MMKMRTRYIVWFIGVYVLVLFLIFYVYYSSSNNYSGTRFDNTTSHNASIPNRNINNNTPMIQNWAYQLQNADPYEIAHSGFQLVVMDYSRDGSDENKYAREEIEMIKRSGKIPIVYLSIGEAEDYRFYWNKSWYTEPPFWLGKENPEWEGNYEVRYWEDEWKSILHQYVDKIIDQGFQGIYLDKVDSFEYWSDESNSEGYYLSEEDAAKRMINLIIDIANYSRRKAGKNFYIIPQNGESILKYDNGSLMRVVSGWASEDLFYDGIHPYDPLDMQYVMRNRIKYLSNVLSHHKFVLSVDYVDDTSNKSENIERIKAYIKKAKSQGFIPYVAQSDRELDELNIIPGIQP